MSGHDSLVLRLVELSGVLPGFHDQNGKWIETSIDARRAVLAGFGLGSADRRETERSLRTLEELRCGLIPRLIPVICDEPISLPVSSDDGETVWRLTDERGEVRDGRSSLVGGHLALPALALGYYALEIEVGDLTGEATVISAPSRCWQPDILHRNGRIWGAASQVYGLQTARSMGIGEYSDIEQAAACTGELGADFLGLSPLHSLFPSDRGKYSPYSPSSRLFLESLHIDVTAVPGFAGSEAERHVMGEDYRRELAQLHAEPLIDHQAVWTLKRPLLDSLFANFLQTQDRTAFDAFRAAQGEPLELHATFEALSEHFHSEGRMWMGEWPKEFRSPHSDVVSWFRQEKERLVSFYAWLQWLADCQLGKAAEAGAAAGMRLGLYRDLAVGSDRGGSEIWAEPDLFSPTLSVGAPPDPLGPQGQNWGLPPMDPFGLERHGLKAFRALVSANMRHAGAIRIDHAFQLQRLFLIPEGGSGADGAYIAFPFKAMLAVLRLESQRAQCVVIAEDLGTAPEGFSDAIMEAGLLSYRVMYFERGEHGRFRRPDEYPRSAMAVFTTHDLPTLRGWWRGLDVDLREKLGVFDAERAEEERAARRHDVAKLSEALHAEGLTDTSDVPAEPPLDAAIRFIARTPCMLAAVQFEDAAGELDQANMPGMDEGHPNWRRKLSRSVEELCRPDGNLAQWARLMNDENRGRSKQA